MGDNFIVIVKEVTMDMDDFLNKVNEKIDEGYRTCGGILGRTDPVSHREYFYIAMIRKELL